MVEVAVGKLDSLWYGVGKGWFFQLFSLGDLCTLLQFVMVDDVLKIWRKKNEEKTFDTFLPFYQWRMLQREGEEEGLKAKSGAQKVKMESANVTEVILLKSNLRLTQFGSQ